MRLFGPFQLPSRLVSIGTSRCQLFNGMSCHLSVNLEHKPLCAMKQLNIDASVTALERMPQILELEEYRFHAFESALLYKEKGNNAKVVVKFMPWVLIQFDDPLSVISNRGTHFLSIFKRVFKLTRIRRLLIIACNPHAISLEEVTNHELELILGKTIDQSLRNWSIKLDESLWAFPTAFKTHIDRHFTLSTI